MARKTKHGCGFEVIARDERGRATTWLVACGCGAKWVGETYERAEDGWREHVHSINGTVISPAGDKSGRWSA